MHILTKFTYLTLILLVLTGCFGQSEEEIKKDNIEEITKIVNLEYKSFSSAVEYLLANVSTEEEKFKFINVLPTFSEEQNKFTKKLIKPKLNTLEVFAKKILNDGTIEKYATAIEKVLHCNNRDFPKALSNLKKIKRDSIEKYHNEKAIEVYMPEKLEEISLENRDYLRFNTQKKLLKISSDATLKYLMEGNLTPILEFIQKDASNYKKLDEVIYTYLKSAPIKVIKSIKISNTGDVADVEILLKNDKVQTKVYTKTDKGWK